MVFFVYMAYEFLDLAIEKSRESVEQGGFPVGVIITIGDEVIATGISDGKALNDPTSHAETAAIRMACNQIGSRALGETATLYSSMEPCLMCYSASVWASIPRIIYAIGRGSLSGQHFEGAHDLASINATSRNPVELIHAASHEPDALHIVRDWEKAQTLQKK